MSITGTIEIPDNTQVVAAGHPLSVSGRVEVSFEWSDFGIGAYEYWGSTGYDSRMGAEDASIVGLDLDDKLPEGLDEQAVIRALDKKLDESEAFQSAVYQQINDAMADPEFGL